MSIQSNLNQLLTIGSAGLYAGQSNLKKELSSDEQLFSEFGKTEAGRLDGKYKEVFEQSQKDRMLNIQDMKNIKGDSIRGLKKTIPYVREKFSEAAGESLDLMKSGLKNTIDELMANKKKQQEELKAQQRLAEKQANEAEQRKNLEIRMKWMQGVREEYGKR